MARGNERQNIYRTAHDRQQFLDRLDQTVRRFDWRCLAFCLMNNHYHLVVETPRGNLSRGMRLLNGAYAQGFNVRHKRDGHLFQGRYRSVLVPHAEHLLVVLRYVARNPVAAGFCGRPEHWVWNSHRAVLGLEHSKLLSIPRVLGWFGDGPGQSRDGYIRFVSDPAADPLDFLGAVDRDLPVESQPAFPHGRPPVEALLAMRPGDAGIVHAYRDYSYSLSEIAAELGCHRAVVGRRLVAFECAEMLQSAS